MNKITPPKVVPILLLILDGFGHRLEGEDNAILLANTPHWDRLCQQYAYATVEASEQFVGLPPSQFGNSEVGHLNIGAGRIVQQDITRIDDDVEHQVLGNNSVIQSVLNTAILQKCVLHVIGLISDGGVHSHERHIHALIKSAANAGVKKICIHAILDGRDTPPKSAERYLQRLEAICHEYPSAYIGSICGRYYAMDRDNRWERIQPAYQLMVEGRGQFTASSSLEALKEAYARNESDEFVQATTILHQGHATTIKDSDVVICMNFRADRMRELVTAMTDPTFKNFATRKLRFSNFSTITRYADCFSFPVAYERQHIYNSFGEYLSKLNLKQLRIAETEKYPHVTYFFNGGREEPFAQEERVLIPSPKVATYDLQPEMSAFALTDRLVELIATKQYDAIICNYANADMVGHTGDLKAAIKAVETLDICVQQCVEAMQKIGGEILIIADHGNCEKMWDQAALQPHTQHTTDPVPFLYIGREALIEKKGALKDVAPSLLQIMGLDKPQEMTGHSLIHFVV